MMVGERQKEKRTVREYYVHFTNYLGLSCFRIFLILQLTFPIFYELLRIILLSTMF
jgi:hypothetical protein